MKSIKFGKYLLYFGIEKPTPIRKSIPEIIIKELRLRDEAAKEQERMRASSTEYALKYEKMLHNIANKITRDSKPSKYVKSKIVMEESFNAQDVYNKMEEIVSKEIPSSIV